VIHKPTKVFKVKFVDGMAAELFQCQNTNFLKELPCLATQNSKRSLSRHKSSNLRSVQGGRPSPYTRKLRHWTPPLASAASLTVLCVWCGRGHATVHHRRRLQARIKKKLDAAQQGKFSNVASFQLSKLVGGR